MQRASTSNTRTPAPPTPISRPPLPDIPLPAHTDEVARKRRANTLAARRSRQKARNRLDDLTQEVESLRIEKEYWKNLAERKIEDYEGKGTWAVYEAMARDVLRQGEQEQDTTRASCLGGHEQDQRSSSNGNATAITSLAGSLESDEPAQVSAKYADQTSGNTLQYGEVGEGLGQGGTWNEYTATGSDLSVGLGGHASLPTSRSPVNGFEGTFSPLSQLIHHRMEYPTAS